MLNKVIELSPVPVTFVWFMPPPYRVAGRYYLYDENGKPCPRRIEVLSRLNNHKKIVVLLHEIGHAKCDEDGCDCAGKDTWLGEYHADMFALKWLLDNKQKKALRISMWWIILRTLGKVGSKYGDAARATRCSDLWAKCRADVSWILGWPGRKQKSF